MPPGPAQQHPWLWFVIPAVLYFVTANAMLQGFTLARPAPKALVKGPYTFRTWYLPDEYAGVNPVGLVGGEGTGLETARITKGKPVSDYGLLLRLLPDAAEGLRVSEVHDYPGDEWAWEWTNDGLVLSPLDSAASPEMVTAPTHQYLRLRSLPDAAAGGKNVTFDTGFGNSEEYYFQLLDAQRLAIMEKPAAPGGRIKLWLVRPGQPREWQQDLDNVAVPGDAWQDGPTLAVLTTTHQLYVLDRKTVRLVEQPKQRGLVAAAQAGSKFMTDFVYSGDCIVTKSRANTSLGLFAADGSSQSLKLLDPKFEGKSAPFATPFSSPTVDYAFDSGRRAGRGRPADALCRSEYNNVSTIAPNRFLLFDDTFERITVLDCKVHHREGSASPSP